MKTTAYRQGGVTFGGFLLFVVLAFMVGKAFITLGPLYLENRLLQQILGDLQEEVSKKNMDTRETLEILRKKLLINNIRYLDTRKIPIKRDDDVVTMTIEYEQRRPYIGNVDLIIRFGPHTLDMPLVH
jgi:hypothetical protein